MSGDMTIRDELRRVGGNIAAVDRNWLIKVSNVLVSQWVRLPDRAKKFYKT